MSVREWERQSSKSRSRANNCDYPGYEALVRILAKIWHSALEEGSPYVAWHIRFELHATVEKQVCDHGSVVSNNLIG